MSDYGAGPASRVADRIRQSVGGEVPAAVAILGSGLGAVAGRMDERRTLDYADVSGFPGASVRGHAGRVVSGFMSGRFVIAFQGRLHQYEGHGAAAAAFPARIAHALGASVLVLINAAGGIRRSLAPGDAVIIDDHINLTFRNPLIGRLEPGDQRFPDMSAPYDARLSAALGDAMTVAGLPVLRGVYAGVLGPGYETPAEVRMLERLGADAVGMSTLPEVIVARAVGMRVAAVSTITNPAAGLGEHPLAHDDVLRAAGRAAGLLSRVLREFVGRLG